MTQQPAPPASRTLPVANGAVSSSADVGVVLVAAGSGTRTASKELKQFRWVAGKPMLLHSVQRFQARPDVAMVVCVLPRSHVGDPPPWLFQSDLERLLISVGGPTRQASVENGLQDLPAHLSIVVVHDAARPLVSDATIDGVIAEARAGRGAVAALPVVDTLKEVGEDGRIALNDLPFDAGQRVEIIVLTADVAETTNPYPLRGQPYRYDDPFGPVVDPEDWEAMK